MTTRRIACRFMVMADLAAAAEIEWAGSADGRTEGEILQLMRTAGVHGQVAELDQGPREVVGLMVYRITKIQVVVGSLTVRADYRRQGVGSLLLERLRASHPQKILRCPVSEANLAAQLFLKARGFRCEAIIRAACAGDLDGYVFRANPMKGDCHDETLRLRRVRG